MLLSGYIDFLCIFFILGISPYSVLLLLSFNWSHVQLLHQMCSTDDLQCYCRVVSAFAKLLTGVLFFCNKMPD